MPEQVVPNSGPQVQFPPPPPGPPRDPTAPIAPPMGPPSNSLTIPIRSDSPVARGGEMIAIAVAGVAVNLIFRASAFATSSTIVTFAIVIVLIARRATARRQTFLLLGAAATLLPWFVLRRDPALIFVTISMELVLLSVAAGFSIRGSAFDTSVRRLWSHVVWPALEWIFGLSMVSRFLKQAGEKRSLGGVLRGFALAVPVLIVFTALLASADAVFAEFLLLDNVSSLLAHFVVSAFFAVLLFGFVSRAAHETAAPDEPMKLRFLGAIEVTMVLGSLVVLFVGFTATQLVVALGGAEHILETEGLTQADHARRGFFQLVWVAGLAGALVGGLRAFRRVENETDSESRRDLFRPMAVLTLALTLVIAAFSLQRFFLYIGTFGLTLDRFWAVAAVLTIGILIVLYTASILGWRANASWFPTTMVLTGAVLIFVLNAIKPAAQVADYNISRGGEAELDTRTLARLPEDAVPTIVGQLNEVPTTEAELLVQLLCQREDRETTYGFLDYNRSAARADAALDGLCPQR